MCICCNYTVNTVIDHVMYIIKWIFSSWSTLVKCHYMCTELSPNPTQNQSTMFCAQFHIDISAEGQQQLEVVASIRIGPTEDWHCMQGMKAIWTKSGGIAGLGLQKGFQGFGRLAALKGWSGNWSKNGDDINYQAQDSYKNGEHVWISGRPAFLSTLPTCHAIQGLIGRKISSHLLSELEATGRNRMTRE